MRKSRMSLSPASFAKLGAIMRTAPDFKPTDPSAMGTIQKLCHSSFATNHVAALSGLLDIIIGVEVSQGDTPSHTPAVPRDATTRANALPVRHSRRGQHGGALLDGLIMTDEKAIPRVRCFAAPDLGCGGRAVWLRTKETCKTKHAAFDQGQPLCAVWSRLCSGRGYHYLHQGRRRSYVRERWSALKLCRRV